MRPDCSNTLEINLELFPYLITYLNGSFSSYLYLFFEMFEYFIKASLRAWMNLSYSYAADSNGFGNFFGGKYLGFFTSSTTVSLGSSSAPSPSTSLPSIPIFFAPLFVELGATIVESFFFRSSFSLTFNLLYGLAPDASCPCLSLPRSPYLSLLMVLRLTLPPLEPPILFFADSDWRCLRAAISFENPGR